MGNKRTLSADPIPSLGYLTDAFNRMLMRRRILTLICALILFLASAMSYLASVRTESIMVLVFSFLMMEGALHMLMSMFANVLMSHGVFSTRFPYGLDKLELSVSIGFGLLSALGGLYVLYVLIVGRYNMDLLSMKEGHELMIISACLYIIHLIILHKSGSRDLSSKSESILIRQELIPLIVIVLGALFLMLFKNHYMDPVLAVGGAIMIIFKGLKICMQAVSGLKSHQQKDYSYRKMCLGILEHFNGSVLSARMKTHMNSQRFCRIKVGFYSDFPEERSQLSREIEQYLLDEFDLDKAHVQLRILN